MKSVFKEFDLNELSRQTGFTVRTIRYYIQKGLLPSPGTGRGLKYGEAYVGRLQLIRQLQKQHFPLDDIKKKLEGMSDTKIMEASEQSPSTQSSAADYIDTVLHGYKTKPKPIDSYELAQKDFISEPTTEPQKENWDRYTLTDDIELHVRRPASRERNRRIERIIAAAERILKE